MDLKDYKGKTDILQLQIQANFIRQCLQQIIHLLSNKTEFKNKPEREFKLTASPVFPRFPWSPCSPC